MTFRQFWPLYLRTHRLPGTRALHYFATAFGILAAVEAIIAQQPWVFILGIATSYVIAICAHWFVERNQPLIRLNAFWGAVADLRMCWLALRGRMEGELAQHGVLQSSLSGVAASDDRELASQSPRRSEYMSYVLLIASTAGLAAGLMDFSDLFEPMDRLFHPIIQLGSPVVAFSGAVIAAFAAVVAVQRSSGALFHGAVHGGRDILPDSSSETGADACRSSAHEASLLRACIALLVFGSVAFVLAELAEHGLANSAHVYGLMAALATLLCVGVVGVWHLAADQRHGDTLKRRPVGASFAGPATNWIMHAFEWRARRFLLRLLDRHLDQAVIKHFRSFDTACQLRATFDSMDYADVNMRDAFVYPVKRDVLAHGLRQVEIDGLYIELGVWRGYTTNFIAEHCGGTVHGFDSFEGLPEDWGTQYRKGTFDTRGERPPVRSNVQLHVGWFDRTLPEFVRENAGPIAFMHVDCDLYSSTATAFRVLGERIVAGTVIVFDEYFNYPGWREHEFKAFQDFVSARQLNYRYLAYNDRRPNANVAVMIE